MGEISKAVLSATRSCTRVTKLYWNKTRKLQNMGVASFTLFLFILIMAHNKYHVNCIMDYHCAISHIETYVRSVIGSIIYLTDAKDSTKLEDTFYRNVLRFGRSSRNFVIITPGMTEMMNFTKIVHPFQSTDCSRIVIFHDIIHVQNILSGLNIDYVRNVKWLYVLSRHYTNQLDVRKVLMNSASVIQNYLSSIQINAQWYVLVDISKTHRIYEIYQVCQKTDYILDEIAQLPMDDNVECKNSHFIWYNRANLKGCPLRVGYFNYGSILTNKFSQAFPLLTLEATYGKPSSRQQLNLNGTTLYGPHIQFFAILQASLNFSVKWVYVADEKFGSLDQKNNDWNGIVGMVQKNQIDTSILDLAITKERSSFVSFTTPFRSYRIKLFMKKPQSLRSWDTFLKVLKLHYWFAMTTSFICCVICIFLSNSRHQDFDILNKRKWTTLSIFGVSIVSTARAFVCMDLNVTPNKSTTPTKSARILILTVCIFGMINYQVYNAGLISSLMVQRYELPINQLDDILTQPGYKLLFTGGAFHESFLKHSNFENYREIWTKTNKEDGVLSSDDDGERQILYDEKKILLALSPDFEMMFDTFPCEVASSKITYGEFPGGYIFSKESNLLDIFNYHIQKITEKGLETESFDEQKNSIIECGDVHDGYFLTLSYNEVISAFYLLFLGCLVASMNMIMEYGYQKWLMRK